MVGGESEVTRARSCRAPKETVGTLALTLVELETFEGL